MTQRLLPSLLAVFMFLPAHARASDAARTAYTRALGQERAVRDANDHATAASIRRVIASYERIVRRYPASGYADNALWQAANLALLAFDRSGDEQDRKDATRLLTMLTKGYSSSSLVPQAQTTLQDIANSSAAATSFRLPSTGLGAGPSTATSTSLRPGKAEAASVERADATRMEKPGAARVERPETARVDKTEATRSEKRDATPATSDPVMLKDIRRSLLPDGVRVTIDLDAEVPFHQEELERPKRVFFDLRGVRAVAALQDVTLKFNDDVVREIRLGRHPQTTTRVVLDLAGVEAYSVYSLYNPYRLVIDFRRTAAARPIIAAPPPLVASLPAPQPPTPKFEIGTPEPAPAPAVNKAPLPSTERTPPSLPPAAPAANSDGKFSISRQLGLSISRIVIDAGHGGHDPGAQGQGISEAELTLDVALRLQKLLLKQPGVDVVMTRETDVFIPLQERTAIANREAADLFLSIHANASPNPKARGIESYFLNFATNPEAEAVAARENAGSGQTMHSLPDIVKAIALNNKINESRDFADIVQKAMVTRLKARNKQLRDLGVKQAPFVVLIGAGMPSVLAEISFVTNKQEGALLKTGAYRQQIAQALFDAVVSYQQGLRRMRVIASKRAMEQ
jgi:N-acetylmuramoyl-L-alanine amidase